MSDAVTLDMWTVYDRPQEHPEHFVARRWEIGRRGTTATADVIKADTLAEVRDQLHGKDLALYRIPRFPTDHASVVESWF